MAGFDWDDANRTHIARHGVSVAEAEEASVGHTIDIDSYVIDDEVRFEDVGMTLAGRILQIVTTDRAGKVRVVTAYDAPFVLRKRYLKSMVNQHE